MAYDYFRRPKLAGTSIKFNRFATIRGSVRRSDPDGVSSVPYFPYATPASTFDLKVNGLTFNIIFAPANPGILTVLSTINTAIAGQGIATDEDGSIGIRSLLTGESGSVEVLGGTAAAAIGFDVSVREINSQISYIPLAPEGRTGNPFGAAFPTKGENLSTDAVIRALAQMSANTDILASTLHRRKSVLQNLGSSGFTITHLPTPPDVPTRFSVIGPVTGPIDTMVGRLNMGSGQADLVENFFLMDGDRLSTSKVVAVVGQRPAAEGDYLYDANNVGEGGNVLGRNLVRAGPIVVDDLKDGTTIISNAGGFGGVKEGDLVEFNEGADPTAHPSVPWRNKGMRWVVESVSASGTRISVRPMSSEEIDLYAVDVSAAKNVFELNCTKTLSQNFGTVTVYAGGTAENVYLVVSPMLYDESVISVWGMAPSEFSKEPSEQVFPNRHSFPYAQRNLPDAFLTRPTVAVLDFDGDGNQEVRVGSFYVRHKDRVCLIKETTLPLDPADTDYNWLVFDFPNRLYIAKSGGEGFYGAGTVIASIECSGGAVLPATLTTSIRVEKIHDGPLTVGGGGQFSTIQEAISFLYLRGFDSVWPEQSTILLLDNANVHADGAPIQAPPGFGGLTIRGAHPFLTCNIVGDVRLFGFSTTLQNLTVYATYYTGENPVDNCTLFNVRVTTRWNTKTYVYRDEYTEIVVTGSSGYTAYLRGSDSYRRATVGTNYDQFSVSFELNDGGVWGGHGSIAASPTSFVYSFGKDATSDAAAGSVNLNKRDARFQWVDLNKVNSDKFEIGDFFRGFKYTFRSAGVDVGAASIQWVTPTSYPRGGPTLHLSADLGLGVIDGWLDADTLRTLTGGAFGVGPLLADNLHGHSALPSLFTINGVAVSANVTAANLSTLTGSGSADTLHKHSELQTPWKLGGTQMTTATATALLNVTGGVSSYSDSYHRHDGERVRAYPFGQLSEPSVEGQLHQFYAIYRWPTLFTWSTVTVTDAYPALPAGTTYRYTPYYIGNAYNMDAAGTVHLTVGSVYYAVTGVGGYIPYGVIRTVSATAPYSVVFYEASWANLSPHWVGTPNPDNLRYEFEDVYKIGATWYTVLFMYDTNTTEVQTYLMSTGNPTGAWTKMATLDDMGWGYMPGGVYLPTPRIWPTPNGAQTPQFVVSGNPEGTGRAFLWVPDGTWHKVSVFDTHYAGSNVRILDVARFANNKILALGWTLNGFPLAAVLYDYAAGANTITDLKANFTALMPDWFTARVVKGSYGYAGADTYLLWYCPPSGVEEIQYGPLIYILAITNSGAVTLFGTIFSNNVYSIYDVTVDATAGTFMISGSNLTNNTVVDVCPLGGRSVNALMHNIRYYSTMNKTSGGKYQINLAYSYSNTNYLSTT